MSIATPSGAPGCDESRLRILDRRFWFRLDVGAALLSLLVAVLETILALRVLWVVIAASQVVGARQHWHHWHTFGRWIDPPDAGRQRQRRQRRQALTVAVPIVCAIVYAAGLII